MHNVCSYSCVYTRKSIYKKKKSSVVKELLVNAPYFVNSLNFTMPKKKKKLKGPKVYFRKEIYIYI